MKKVTQKSISLLLCFTILFGVMQSIALPAFAAETKGITNYYRDSGLFKDSKVPVMILAGTQTSKNWKDHFVDSFAGGSGTQNSPYQIATEEQLSKLAVDVAKGNAYNCTYFQLTSDLDLSAYRWNPIGLSKWDLAGNSITSPFGGVFDGNGKTITGLYVDERSDGYSAGLFGYIQEDIHAKKKGGTPAVKNLTISDAEIYSSESGLSEMESGILAGEAMVNDGQRIVISNVKVSGSVINEMTQGQNSSGGMIGSACRVDFTKCSANKVTVSGASNSGGFVGIDSNCTFTDCSASGEVSGTWAIGGFSGFSSTSTLDDAHTQSAFEKCIANVDLAASDWRVGGFIGFAQYGKIDNCAAIGKVTSEVTNWQPKAGGFCGEIKTASIHQSYAAGQVICSHPNIKAGGFIGYDNAGTTTDCVFDSTKNPTLTGIGQTKTEGSNDIKTESSSFVLSKICTDICGSDSISKVEAKVPTKTEDGNIEYWYCSVCEKYFSDKALTKEISKQDTIIPATGDIVKTKSITSIEGLPAAKSVANDTALDALNLPASLSVTTGGAKETVNVTWNSTPKYSKEVAGMYTFTPVLPTGYVLSTEVNATYKITVNPAANDSGNHSGDSSEHHSSSIVSTPSLPSSVTDGSSNATADLSGVSFPSGVTKITLSVTPQTQNTLAAPQAASVFHAAASNASLKAIGTPFVYDIKLMNQSGSAITGFSGMVTVRLPLPAGLKGTPHIFRYEESTKNFTDLNATLENGFLVFSTTHFSYYVIVGTGDSITLDTTNYTMPINGVYHIGTKLVNTKGATVKISSSDCNVATVMQFANGVCRVNGKKSGTADIFYDIYDTKKKKIASLKVKIHVVKGSKPFGNSARQIAVF